MCYPICSIQKQKAALQPFASVTPAGDKSNQFQKDLKLVLKLSIEDTL